jgi:CO/xanthine dehydrogenase Mo-binding subunit
MVARAIGQSVHRADAIGKVTGQTAYPGDLSQEGMLHMKVLFSERAHARIRSIDTSAAEALPGIVAVMTARDVPVNEYGLIMPDQPVLCGPGSTRPDADIVRTTMDHVALIVAQTDAIASQARALIRVDYEDLPAVFDPFEAMAHGAVQIHAGKPRNIVQEYHVRKGDMGAGWAAAEVVVEGSYTTSWQEHAYLQPEAGLAYIDEEGRITVEVAGQWTHEDQHQVCHALGLPADRVRIIYPAIGGAFGGREDMSVQIVLALAAYRLQRPVKIVWSREESIKGHHKRHPYTIKAKWGATRDGRLTAAEVLVVSDAGAYAYTSTKVLGNATMMCVGPYIFPNVHVDSYTVYTNNLPTGAFRGFGGPQAAFAAESQMNKLAEKLRMDPVEIRLKNILRDGDLTHVGTPLPQGVSMSQTMEACAQAAGWQPAEGRWLRPEPGTSRGSHRRRGLGVACGFKNVGFSFGAPENCAARIELRGGAQIDEVILYHAGADVGQGAHTVFAQMAAEAVGVALDRVRVVASDTATSGNSGSASASRLTFMAGNAIRGAAEAALRVWKEEDRPAVGDFVYRPPATTMFDHETGACNPNFAYGYVAEAVEVEIDLETGLIDVIDVVCANDVGRALNPQQIEGQIEGGVVQAHGYALIEHFQMKDGHVLTPYLSNYLIPGVLDVPQRVRSVILEVPNPTGPWGVRGMAEMPFVPYSPALTAALHDATGIWFDSLPLTPDRVVEKLRAAGLGT